MCVIGLIHVSLCCRYCFAEVGLALRCPASKFITHTLSHMSFLFLLAAATFRLDGATHPISFNMSGMDSAAVMSLTAGNDDGSASSHFYAESVENVIKSTFRPANILMTNVQICLMFWIFGLFFICFCRLSLSSFDLYPLCVFTR